MLNEFDVVPTHLRMDRMDKRRGIQQESSTSPLPQGRFDTDRYSRSSCTLCFFHCLVSRVNPDTSMIDNRGLERDAIPIYSKQMEYIADSMTRSPRPQKENRSPHPPLVCGFQLATSDQDRQLTIQTAPKRSPRPPRTPFSRRSPRPSVSVCLFSLAR